MKVVTSRKGKKGNRRVYLSHINTPYITLEKKLKLRKQNFVRWTLLCLFQR